MTQKLIERGKVMNDMLKNILISAYENTQYYKNLFDYMHFDPRRCEGDFAFTNVPPLTRDDIVMHSNKILNNNYSGMRKKSLKRIRTSGSSGKFIEVFWEPQELLASNMCVWRKRQKWYGITPKDKQCSFVSGITIGATVSSSIETLIQVDRNTLNLSVLKFDDNIINDFYTRIVEFSPDWIYTTPSAIIRFIDFCNRMGYKKPYSVKYVELYGELVSPAAYDIICSYFEVPCAVMYGAKEVNTIALMCPHGHLHILSDNINVENVNGVLLLTSLKNFAFPIIRYAIGDVLEIENINCRCGESGNCINKFWGREAQISFIKGSNGLTTKVLGNAVYVANERLGNPILQYQVEIAEDCVVLLISIKESYRSWKNSIVNEIYNCLMDYCVCRDRVEVRISDSFLEMNHNTAKMTQFINRSHKNETM